VIVKEGKGFVVYCFGIPFSPAGKPGNREIRIIFSLFIDDLPIIKAKKIGTIIFVAYWALGFEGIDYFNNF